MLFTVLVVIVGLWAVVLGFLEGVRGASWYSVFSMLLIGVALGVTGFLLSPDFLKGAIKDSLLSQGATWGALLIMVCGGFMVVKSISCAIGTLMYKTNQALTPKIEESPL